jgi:hypothetical protein
VQRDDAVGLVDRVGAEIGDHAPRHRLVLLRRPDHPVVRGEAGPVGGHHLRGEAAAGVEMEHSLGARAERLDRAAVLLDVVDRHQRPSADELLLRRRRQLLRGALAGAQHDDEAG